MDDADWAHRKQKDETQTKAFVPTTKKMDGAVELIAQISLQQAAEGRKALRGLAKLRTSETAKQLMGTKKLTVERHLSDFEALAKYHLHASNGHWAADRIPTAFEYGKDHLFVAAVIIAAHLKVNRKCDDGSAANHIASFLIAAHSQVAGCCQGYCLDVIRFEAAAAALNGTSLDGRIAKQAARGFSSNNNEARDWQAY